MSKFSRPITTCRSCGSRDLVLVLEFAPTALCESYTTTTTKDTIYPLSIHQCLSCCLVQLGHVISHDDVFENYYKNTPSFSRDSNYVGKYVASVMSQWNGKNAPFVVQIGSQDGGLLIRFSQVGCRVLGVESNSQLVQIATNKGIQTVAGNFNLDSVRALIRQFGPADIVIVDNSFGTQHPDHLANCQNINEYASVVSELLDESGLLVISTNHIEKMLDRGVFDLFYHEHCAYFSNQSISNLFRPLGIKLVEVDQIVPGSIGSMFYFKKCSGLNPMRKTIQVVNKLPKNRANRYCQSKDWGKMARQMSENKTKLETMIGQYSGQKVVGYGASASVTTVIYQFELGTRLEFLVDDNLDKVGKYSPGFNLPVQPTKSLYQSDIGLIIILAYRYADAIKNKHPTLQSKMVVASH